MSSRTDSLITKGSQELRVSPRTCGSALVMEFLFLLSSPLSPEKGKQLMDEVAHILRVPSSFFADVK